MPEMAADHRRSSYEGKVFGETPMPEQQQPRFGLPVAGLVIIGIVYLIYAWDRIVFPIELVEISKSFGFELAAAGFLATVFVLGIALTAIPAGFVVMRYGTRASLVVGAVIFSLATGYTAMGHGLVDLTIARVVSGVGEGLYNIALFSFLGGLSDRYRGTLTGLAASLFGIGLFLGPPLVAAILDFSGRWETAFWVFAAAGIIGAVLIGFTLPGHDVASAKATGPVTWRRLVSVLAGRNLAVAAIMAINGFGLYSFLGLYETFLRTAHRMDLATASAVFSLFGIGSVIGGSPAGYLADRIGRKLYLLLALIGCAVFGVAAYTAPPTPWLLAALCFLFGLAVNSIYTNCYALVQDQVAKDDIPLGTGVLATIYFLMGAISGYLLVQARDAFGWGAGSVAAYGAPYVVAALIIVGLMLWDRSRVAQADSHVITAA
jgi:predicted MFS family arabinose efflux permease